MRRIAWLHICFIFSCLFLDCSIHSSAAVTASDFVQKNALQEIAAKEPEFANKLNANSAQSYPVFIFIPGILGSKLVRGNKIKQPTTIWGAFSFLDTPDLRIRDDDDVEPATLLEFDAAGFPKDVYGQTIEQILTYRPGNLKYFYQFPYDWRQSNRKSADRLNKWLCDSGSELAGRPIIFLAHSMGGLVLKDWLQRHYSTRCAKLDIKKAWFFGTPHVGSPKSLRAFAENAYLIADGYTGVVGAMLRGADTATLSKALNKYGMLFPSIYQLMPIYNEKCVAAMPNNYAPGKPLQFDGIEQIQLFEEGAWERLNWPNGLDETVISRKEFYEKHLGPMLSEAYRFLCDTATKKLPSEVEVTYFHSDEHQTDWSFHLKEKGRLGKWWNKGSAYEIDNVVQGKGDGTVPLFSSRNEFGNEITKPPLQRGELAYCPQEHMDLLKCPQFKVLATLLLRRAQQYAVNLTLQQVGEAARGSVIAVFARSDALLALPTDDIGKSWTGQEFEATRAVNNQIAKRLGLSSETITKAAVFEAQITQQTHLISAAGGLDIVDPATKAQLSASLIAAQARQGLFLPVATNSQVFDNQFRNVLNANKDLKLVTQSVDWAKAWSKVARDEPAEGLEELRQLRDSGYSTAFEPPTTDVMQKFDWRGVAREGKFDVGPPIANRDAIFQPGQTLQ